MSSLITNSCSVCGHKNNNFPVTKVINQELSTIWGLDTKMREKFDARESSNCAFCGNSARSRGFASAILKTTPLGKAGNFHEWIFEANRNNLHIAEINSCGKLHPVLSQCNHLSYSEYVPGTDFKTRVKNWLKGIKHQDIEKLTYPDNSFDLVLHTEVLEHVNQPMKAIKECVRILKPGGYLLFTVPLIMDRKSVRKARIANGKINYIGSPSYHGSGENDNLVFWEFGGDVIKKWRTRIVYEDHKKELYVLGIRK